MRSQIDNIKRTRAIAISIIIAISFPCFSQTGLIKGYICPDEQTAFLLGSNQYNDLLKSELIDDEKIVAAQTSIDLEFAQMKTWQARYNDYLTTASGYASTLKASTTLYDEGVKTFISLIDLKKSVEKNPSGLFSAALLNDIFLETGSELISIFTTLENSIDKGGNENMLTGAERNQLLWELDDRMKALNKKLRLLAISIRMYTLSDVWYSATTGIVERTTADVAKHSLKRWAQAAGASESIVDEVTNGSRKRQ